MCNYVTRLTDYSHRCEHRVGGGGDTKIGLHLYYARDVLSMKRKLPEGILQMKQHTFAAFFPHKSIESALRHFAGEYVDACVNVERLWHEMNVYFSRISNGLIKKPKKFFALDIWISECIWKRRSIFN